MAHRIRTFRSAVLWVIWLGLVAIWIATLWQKWQSGSQAAVAFAILDIALLFILYFAEGMELAITDLLDKEPAQLRDETVRRLLAEIQRRSGFFFAQRQVFVVVIISVISLTTSYNWIEIPFYGKVTAHSATFWFSLAFTTFTVLWFCQVTPKRLAVNNSELFLKQSSTVWRLIKAISTLGLPDPSDLLVYIIQRYTSYSQERHLLPGRAAHYDITAHLFGFSLDSLHTAVNIRHDGSGFVRKKFLILFLRGHHSRMYGSMSTRSSFAENPRIELKALHVLPVPERIESIASTLDSIFNETGDIPGNLMSEWMGRMELSVEENGMFEGGQDTTWSIEGQPLPESLWPQAGNSAGVLSGPPMVAFLYEVEAEVTAGGFNCSGGEDEWPETIGLPCRAYSISIKPLLDNVLESREVPPETDLSVVVGGCNVTLVGPGTEMSEETLKLTQAAVAGRGDLRVSYPLQGGCYTLSWRIFRRLKPA